MLDSLIISVQDFENNKQFYAETLKVLGYFCLHSDTTVASWKQPLSKAVTFSIKAITNNKKPNMDISFSFVANNLLLHYPTLKAEHIYIKEAINLKQEMLSLT